MRIIRGLAVLMLAAFSRRAQVVNDGATTGASTISPTANLLVNGKVLLVGGWTGNGQRFYRVRWP